MACALVIAERVGKSVRSPAKDTLLSHATAATGRGRGRGFAVHEALDQIDYEGEVLPDRDHVVVYAGIPAHWPIVMCPPS
ncbi:hypothetical protein MLGJGCBP_07952 [Rhodococcus sp. T7]|uniref:Uncharacterized protein n=2 Tax=Rhodococcus opacus TaxID=37919 RepID=C1BCT0_RHOOB|nr:hypothetical protein W59_03991 [Rhodococcus opacus RKJ300 = JCM 13270]KAF0957793.1 hypothetical protein MLGJGCBP_09625 [Rhodococcus sp. T7]KAF0958993.1 hypothetical protein MLGJGCBP_07952 [Rhodococcus sp. T7]BAH55674.1 hypothetical protein ROP_pROB01-01750 [Rhodococcus opacus B4]